MKEERELKIKLAASLYINDLKKAQTKDMTHYLSQVRLEVSEKNICPIVNTINSMITVGDVFPWHEDAKMTMHDYSKKSGGKEVYIYQDGKWHEDVNAKGLRIEF